MQPSFLTSFSKDSRIFTGTFPVVLGEAINCTGNTISTSISLPTEECDCEAAGYYSLPPSNIDTQPFIYDCVDGTSINCYAIVYGCTNPRSEHYNPLANVDDGTCDCRTGYTQSAYLTGNLDRSIPHLYSVIYGDGVYVILGNTGADHLSISYDGLIFNQISTPPLYVGYYNPQPWTKIIYTGHEYILFSLEAISVSTDLITWNTHGFFNVFGTTGKDITYGDGKIVIVGPLSNTSAIISDNLGISWSIVTIPYANQWSVASYGGGKFIIMSLPGYGDPSHVASSEDGINWTEGSIDGSINYLWWKKIIYGNGTYFALAEADGNVVPTNWGGKSTDGGLNWTQVDIGQTDYWVDAVYAGCLFVIFTTGFFGGQNYNMLYSEDLVTWTGYNFPIPSEQRLKAFGVYHDGKLSCIVEGSSMFYMI